MGWWVGGKNNTIIVKHNIFTYNIFNIMYHCGGGGAQLYHHGIYNVILYTSRYPYGTRKSINSFLLSYLKNLVTLLCSQSCTVCVVTLQLHTVWAQSTCVFFPTFSASSSPLVLIRSSRRLYL